MTCPSMLAGIGDYFSLWQIPLVIALVALLVFWKIYRGKQM